MLSSLRTSCSIICKWRRRVGCCKILFLISETTIFATDIPATGFLVSPVYLNPGQVSLPISSQPSLQADLHVTMGVEVLLVATAARSEPSLWAVRSLWPTSPTVPCHQVQVTNSKNAPVSQECLCLTWQVASLPYSGQDVGVGKFSCFLLEITCLARHKPFGCSEGDLPPFGGQRRTWPTLLRNPGVSSTIFYPRPKVKPEGLSSKIMFLTWMSTRPFLRCPRHPQVSAIMAVVDLLSHWCSIHSFGSWLCTWRSVCQALCSRTGEGSMGRPQFHILQFHFPLAWGGGREKEKLLL